MNRMQPLTRPELLARPSKPLVAIASRDHALLLLCYSHGMRQANVAVYCWPMLDEGLDGAGEAGQGVTRNPAMPFGE